jgi:hypothetical protein
MNAGKSAAFPSGQTPPRLRLAEVKAAVEMAPKTGFGREGGLDYCRLV